MTMNKVEQRIVNEFPQLERIASNQFPREVGIAIPRYHNPDFKLFFPERGAGLYIEVKGHIRSSTWIPMLKFAPDSFKAVYRVVIVDTNKNQAKSTARALDKVGIKHSTGTMPKQWLIDATELYLANREAPYFNWYQRSLDEVLHAS